VTIESEISVDTIHADRDLITRMLTNLIDNSDIFALSVDRNHSILFINENLKDVLFRAETEEIGADERRLV